MRPEDRRHQIVEMLVRDGSATLESLAQRFAVSKMTIHRDLDGLEAEGLLRKIRGGATIEASGQFESDYRYRARIAPDEKRRIARRAVEFVEPGMSVLIDDGSTSLNAVPFLLEKRPLTVITNGMAVMEALADIAGIELMALGGVYSRKFHGYFGVLTEAALAGLRADIVLMSSSSIQGRTAFHQDEDVLGVKRLMIGSSVRRFLLADHRKFGRTALHLLADLEAFDGVVTSSAVGPGAAEALRRDGIRLYLAEET